MPYIECRSDKTARVIQEVVTERVNQERQHGDRSLIYRAPAIALPVLVEEVGEVARAILTGDHDNFREELVQVAAVAVAMVEALDRQRSSN